MSILEAILLGITQGVTEFLPISSTGHLILVRSLFSESAYGTLSFDAILQLSTTFAVLIYFRKDLLDILFSIYKFFIKREVDENFKLSIFIFIGTIPAIFFGILLEEKMNTVFRDVKYVSLFLILGGALMYFAERYHKNILNFQKLNFRNSLKIGLFQSLALLPGFSRSGSTISGGLFSSLGRVEAVRFSFLLSVPILLGTGIKKLTEIGSISNKPELLVSSLFAFIFGILSIHFLLKFLKSQKLYVFIIYRIILSFVIFIFIL